jgi:PAS domain S-box-containing protein
MLPLKDRRADAVIRQERDRAQQYLDIADVILLALDLEGRITLINRKGCSTLGWEEHELLGRDWVDFCLPARLRDALRTSFRKLIGGDLSYRENPVLTKSGEERMIGWRNTLLRDDRGEVIGTLSSGEDITERKLAEEDRMRVEEALRSSEREHRNIAAQLERERARLVEAQEVAKIGSWETELQSLDVIWSEQTHRIFETDPLRFHPTRPKFREFIPPEDRAKVDEAFAASLDKRSTSTVEYRIVMPDGRVKVLEERWQAFHDEEGKPVRVAGTCRDITERVRAEEELQRLSGQLLRLQDEERRRMARDLHDSTGQDLVALATTLSQLHASIPSSSRKLRKLALQCRALADQCVGEVRTLSYL